MSSTAISLRVLSRRRLSLGDLVDGAMMPETVAGVLRASVAARLSLLIAGGTGTGKTTLLGALLAGVDPGERIVTIEDAPELAVEHPHVLGLVARSANIERAGAVSLRELVRQALRMRVDRLVVGEFRGGEIIELLAALNTGHSGGAATVHANSVADVPARLVALAAVGGMSAEVVAVQAASALDVVIQLGRERSGQRRIVEIAVWNRGTPAPVWSARDGIGAAAAELADRLEASGTSAPTLLRGGPQ